MSEAEWTELEKDYWVSGTSEIIITEDNRVRYNIRENIRGIKVSSVGSKKFDNKERALQFAKKLMRVY